MKVKGEDNMNLSTPFPFSRLSYLMYWKIPFRELGMKGYVVTVRIKAESEICSEKLC
jgi:hypothetical protein